MVTVKAPDLHIFIIRPVLTVKLNNYSPCLKTTLLIKNYK